MDYRRVYAAGGRYFFTVVTAGRRPLLTDHIDHLRHAFRLGMQRRPFALQAIVVLPDHLHAIWQLPDGDHDFATRWMIIKRSFTVAVGGGRVWQGRYWEHLLRDEADWRRHMDYVHFNPVKHGYLDAPGAWPYSSFRRAVAKGWYEAEWGRQEPAGLVGMDPE